LAEKKGSVKKFVFYSIIIIIILSTIFFLLYYYIPVFKDKIFGSNSTNSTEPVIESPPPVVEKSFYTKWWFWLFIFLLIALIIIVLAIVTGRRSDKELTPREVQLKIFELFKIDEYHKKYEGMDKWVWGVANSINYNGVRCATGWFSTSQMDGIENFHEIAPGNLIWWVGGRVDPVGDHFIIEGLTFEQWCDFIKDTGKNRVLSNLIGERVPEFSPVQLIELAKAETQAVQEMNKKAVQDALESQSQ